MQLSEYLLGKSLWKKSEKVVSVLTIDFVALPLVFSSFKDLRWDLSKVSSLPKAVGGCTEATPEGPVPVVCR